MFKKTMLFASAIGALVAFAVPAAASAQQLAETPGGALSAGAQVTLTSSNTRTTTAGGTFECENVTIQAEVTANSSTTSALSAALPDTTSGCSLNQTALGGSHIPITLTDTTVSIHLTDSHQGTMTTTFIVHLPGNPCHFASTIGVTFTTGTDQLHTEGTLTGTGTGCPPVGTMAGDYTLETSDGTTVFTED